MYFGVVSDLKEKECIIPMLRQPRAMEPILGPLPSLPPAAKPAGRTAFSKAWDLIKLYFLAWKMGVQQ